MKVEFMDKPKPQTKEAIQEELVREQFANAEMAAFEIVTNTVDHIPNRVLIQALAIACGTIIGNEDWKEEAMPAFFEVLRKQIEDRARFVKAVREQAEGAQS